MLRLHIPLIKPDVRFFRIRLSDRLSRFRPRKVTRAHCEPNQMQLLVHRSVSAKLVTSSHRPDCFRLERPVAGWDSHPLEIAVFARLDSHAGVRAGTGIAGSTGSPRWLALRSPAADVRRIFSITAVVTNSKLEIRNSKQIRNPKFEEPKRMINTDARQSWISNAGATIGILPLHNVPRL